jgi:hypothetical protein
MRYWDGDLPDWDAGQREFAVAWRQKPKEDAMRLTYVPA